MNKKINTKQQYVFFDKFLVRTPAMPFDIEKINQPIFSHPKFKEAIFNSSVDFYVEIEKYLNNKTIEHKEKERIFDSLFKYWRRISTRATPYGLFSGVTVGQIGNQKTEIVFNNATCKYVRIDTAVLFNIIEKLEYQFKNQLVYFPNDTIYKVGGDIRYYERRFENQYFKHSISSLENDTIIRKVLSLSIHGSKVSEIVLALKTILPHYEDDEIEEYVHDLIDSKVLKSELLPSLTHHDQLQEIIHTIYKINPDSQSLSQLRQIQNKLELIRAGKTENFIQDCENIISVIKEIGVEYDKKNVIQVDLYKNTNVAHLNQEICNNLLGAIDFLSKISPEKASNENLELFKKVFSEKYSDREMDLMFVCDADVGIGYPVSYDGEAYSNKLVDKLVLPQIAQHGVKPSGGSRQNFLLEKTLEALGKGENEIILTDEDISNDKPKPLFPTFYCGFQIVGSNNGEYLLKLNSAGGTSGANMISRFTHLHDDIEKFVGDITAKEQEAESSPILEIVHLPYPRMGNILTRLTNRKYELNILTNSGISEDCRIPISDLKISIKNNRIIIRSKKLNREVKFAHTNAFNNVLSTLPVFNFLCDLHYQEHSVLGVTTLERLGVRYMPRVRYKNVILEPASWSFTKADFAVFFVDNVFEVSLWRERYSVPQYIVFVESDNELFIDLVNELHIKSLVRIIRKNNQVLFHEFLLSKDSSVVRDIEKNIYNNEFIVSFYKANL